MSRFMVLYLCYTCIYTCVHMYVYIYMLWRTVFQHALYTLVIIINVILCDFTPWHYTPIINFTGSPNCPALHTTISTTTLAVSIQKLQVTWLPEWYCVQVISNNGSIASIVHSSTLKGSTSLEVTSLEPDTVYNISVTPCNMAGCNESCDVHSVQTDSDTSIAGGEMCDFAQS